MFEPFFCYQEALHVETEEEEKCLDAVTDHNTTTCYRWLRVGEKESFGFI